MLALTRKIGEKIVINDNITVTVVDIKGESIRLAIDAPREIKIYRGELYEAIIAENKRATAPMDIKQLDVLKDIAKPE